jgi:hypothetical protein
MIPELGDDVPVETRQQLRHSPKLWMRNALRHPVDPSRPYDFKTTDNRPLSHLLHEDSWIYPDNWADINVLLLARGELKSFTTGALATWAHDAFPQLHTYYIAPSNDQVYDYVEPIRETYVEQANMDGRRKTNNKGTQVFKTYRETDEGDLNPILGRFQTDSGYSEKSVRGKHSQLGITDETQDLTERVFNVFLPAIDKQLPDVDWFPTTFCIGTPKESGSFYEDLWERSDKRTWGSDEEEWVFQSSVDPYELTAEDVADLPGNVTIEEGESYTVHGWHVDWINSPLHDGADIARAKRTMGEMEFANEVLAQFYEPEDNLLSDEDVRACFTPDYNFRESPYNEDSTTVVCADWGGGKDQNASDTVLLAAEAIEYENGETEYVLLDIEFLDTSLRNKEQIREYESWVLQYDADIGLVDYGFGQQAMESLQHGDDTMDPDGYMDTVSAVHYGHVKDKTAIKWTTDEDGNETFFTCDKSRAASAMVESVRDDEWVMPQATAETDGLSIETSEDDGVRVIEQLTAPYKTLSESNTGNKRVYIETPGNARDDTFDVLTFAVLAFKEIDGTDESVTAFAGRRRAGA